MLSVREVMGFKVVSAKGRKVGRVFDVLFSPRGCRVVGFLVERPRFLGLLDRKQRYVALDRCDIVGKRVEVAAGKASWGRAAQSRIGSSWDETVIWLGMPVRTERGELLGSVRDVLFDAGTGEIDALGLSGGITADLAIGVRDLPARWVQGFDGSAIIVDEIAIGTDTSGGAAAAAGKGAAVARKAGEEAAKKAIEVGRTAAAYGASAVKVAAGSKTGKKAANWFKAIKDEVVDAMGDSDDD